MANFTSGRLQVAVFRVQTTATLEDLREGMLAKRPVHANLAPGWGSVADDDDVIGEHNVAPEPGDPTIEPEDDLYPERLAARLYYFVADAAARAALGADATPQRTHWLRAVDFYISRLSSETVMVIVSTRNLIIQTQVIEPQLRALFVGADENALLQPDSSPLDLGHPDVFMWLLHRFGANKQLTPGLRLFDLREITSRDVLSRGANLSQGVDLGRRELLALITNDSIVFGPAKLSVSWDATNAYLDFELFLDGGFAVHSTESQYAEPLGRAAKGPRAVLDLAYGVVPALREAFEADGAWRASGKAAFVDSCLQGLRAGPLASSDDDVCPHCGKPLHDAPDEEDEADEPGKH